MSAEESSWSSCHPPAPWFQVAGGPKHFPAHLVASPRLNQVHRRPRELQVSLQWAAAFSDECQVTGQGKELGSEELVRGQGCEGPGEKGMEGGWAKGNEPKNLCSRRW